MSLSGQFLELEHAIKQFVKGPNPTPALNPTDLEPFPLFDGAYVRFKGVEGIGSLGHYDVPKATAMQWERVVGFSSVSYDNRLTVEPVLYHEGQADQIEFYAISPAPGYQIDNWRQSQMAILGAMSATTQHQYTGSSNRTMRAVIIMGSGSGSSVGTTGEGSYFPDLTYAGSGAVNYAWPFYAVGTLQWLPPKIAIGVQASYGPEDHLQLTDLDVIVWIPVKAADP